MQSKSVFKEVGYWSKVVVLGAALGVGLQFAQAAWTPAPAGDPTTATVSGPITTGAGQIKDGNLILNTGLNGIPVAANGLIVANGKVGIGDSTPDGTLKVDVEGNVGASAYCDKNGLNCATPPFATTASMPRKSYSVLVSNNTMYSLNSPCDVRGTGISGLGSAGELVACGTSCNRYCRNAGYAAGLLNGMTTTDTGCTCFD